MLQITSNYPGEEFSEWGAFVMSRIAARGETQMDVVRSLTSTTAPIHMSIDVHAPVSTDFRNNDYLILKRTDEAGAMTSFCQGRAGAPQTHHSRKQVSVAMQAAVTPQPLGPPIRNPSRVMVRFLGDNGEVVNPPIATDIPRGEPWAFVPPSIMGYTFTGATINGEAIGSILVSLQDPREDNYDVALLYSMALENVAFRILVNSLYSVDGVPRVDWHWTRQTAFATEGADAFRTPTDRFRHGYTNDEIRIQAGTILRLEPNVRFAHVESVEPLNAGEFLIVFSDAALSSEQANAPLTSF